MFEMPEGVTIIFSFSHMFDNAIRSFFNSKHVPVSVMTNQIYNAIGQVYNKLENKCYSKEEIREEISYYLAKYFATTVNENSVYVLGLYYMYDPVKFVKFLKEKIKINVYYLHIHTKPLIETFVSCNSDYYMPPTLILFRTIETSFKLAEVKADYTMDMNYDEIAKFLSKVKKYYDDEADIKLELESFFGFFKKRNFQLKFILEDCKTLIVKDVAAIQSVLMDIDF
jgi:hypothetical protein